MQTQEQTAIKALSERIIQAQESIRILDAIRWDDSIKQNFFASDFKKQPVINENSYRPLGYDVSDKILEFEQIIRDTKNQLGSYTVISRLVEQRCLEYIKAIRMLGSRGTTRFSEYSQELYGSPDDVFYHEGPKLADLGDLLAEILTGLCSSLKTDSDEKKYNANQAQTILQKKLSEFFSSDEEVLVEISDTMVADAAAGADRIKLNSSSHFSDRDLRYLEVHEGWVHVGTTLNGLKQPYCKFLAKGSPASSVTQEGLAVITEVFTFSSYPARLLKLTNRIRAIQLVKDGATFIDIFQFFKKQNYSDDDAYNYTTRVFRGSNAESGPFTKDLSYIRGFVMIYNYLRLAVQKDLVHTIPMFFVGKTLIEEVKDLSELMAEGLIIPPTYLPPQFMDLSALSSWMSFSLFLNKFDLAKLSKQLTFI